MKSIFRISSCCNFSTGFVKKKPTTEDATEAIKTEMGEAVDTQLLKLMPQWTQPKQNG
jgi:hypothetical protein